MIHKLCPIYAKEVLPKFRIAPASLSRVGMAENEENGRFLRERYREFLPKGRYPYNGSFAFFSEREQRNVVSTIAVSQGMFPIGTGLRGFAKERPNLVPIMTTQDGADVLMNCPRDGPCQHALEMDKDKWIAEHEADFYKENRELFHEVGKACGYEIKPGGKKGVVLEAKNVADAFGFAENEGLDSTMGGRLNETTVRRFRKVLGDAVHDLNFGKPHQLTYWVAEFIPHILGLSRVPLVQPENLFHLFLNHRELIYGIAHIWGMPIDFPGMSKDNFPTASSIIIEVYDHGVKTFFWTPTLPDTAAKAKYLSEELPVRDLYHMGRLWPTAATGCHLHQVCPVEQLVQNWLALVRRTGTYVDICNVSKEDTFFAKGEVSLGIMEDWIQGQDTSTGAGMNLVASRAKSASSESLRVGVTWLAGVAVLAAVLGGLIGHRLGQRRPHLEMVPQAPYFSAPS